MRSKNKIHDLNIHSALDLREQPHACKKVAEHGVATGIAVAPLQLLPDRLKLHAHRALPLACTLCSGRECCSMSGRPNLYKGALDVFHGALSVATDPRIDPCTCGAVRVRGRVPILSRRTF